MTAPVNTLDLAAAPPAAESDPAALRPFVSIVVPVRNEARCIAGTLAQLLGQDYPPERFEVIVVDGASTDDTWQIVAEMLPAHRNLKLIANPKRWSSAARNLGICVARGEIVLIVDGHCDIGRDDYLTELVTAFDRTGADCLGRPQPLEVGQPSPLQRAIAVARASRLGHHPASHVFSTREMPVPAHSVAVAYRRAVFERIGLFDESFDACEDVEFNHRVDLAGMRCCLVPALRVSYHPRASLRGLFRQMVRYGRGRMRLLRKHPGTFSPLGFAPAIFVALAALGPLSLLYSESLARWYAAAIVGYAAALVAYSAVLARRAKEWSLLARLPAVFAALHCGAGTGIVVEALWPNRARSRGYANGGRGLQPTAVRASANQR